MESRKPTFFLFFVICSLLFSATLSRKPLFVARTGNGSDGSGDSLQCMQQLMSCRPYLKGSNTPASTCCIPLKQAVANEPHRLCCVFNNQALMNSFNVTLDDVMALAQACGAHADTSVCKEVAASPKSPAIPSSSKGESPCQNNNLTTLGFGHGGGQGGGGGRGRGRSRGGLEPEPEPSSSFPRGMPWTGQYSNAVAELVPNIRGFILASTAAASSIVISFF